MCERCHYLTEILLQIIHENASLTVELRKATAADDVEGITSHQKAMEENEAQIRFSQERIEEHFRNDHPENQALAAPRMNY